MTSPSSRASNNDPDPAPVPRNIVPALRRASVLLTALCLLHFASLAFAQSSSVTPNVVVLHLDDTNHPVSEEDLDRGLAEAHRDHADAILIDLDTPGGLLDTTRSMVSRLLASPVSVI